MGTMSLQGGSRAVAILGLSLLACGGCGRDESQGASRALLAGKWRLAQTDSIDSRSLTIKDSKQWEPGISVESFTPDGMWHAKQRKGMTYVHYSGNYTVADDLLTISSLDPLPESSGGGEWTRSYRIKVITREALVLDSYEPEAYFFERDYYERLE